MADFSQGGENLAGELCALHSLKNDSSMEITLRLPRTLEQRCDGKRELRLQGATVRAVLEALHREYPDLYECICNETGTVRQHVHLFVNNDLLGGRDGVDTRLEPGDVLSVFPAVSGG